MIYRQIRINKSLVFCRGQNLSISVPVHGTLIILYRVIDADTQKQNVLRCLGGNF